MPILRLLATILILLPICSSSNRIFATIKHAATSADLGYISSSFQMRPGSQRQIHTCEGHALVGRKFIAVPLKARNGLLRTDLAVSMQVDGTTKTVKAVFTDVDGTLFNSKHRLSDETKAALLATMDAGIPVVMATGKARGSWVGMLRESIGLSKDGWTLNGPGVFIQGLLVCDKDGKVIKRTLLENKVVRRMNTFAAERGVSIIAYTTDDRIVAARTDQYTDMLIPYNEPIPQAIGSETMDNLGTGNGLPEVFKMILMGPEPKLAALRADLEHAVDIDASVTKAMDCMLEVLPPGASKGLGVKHALDILGLRPGDCMALGDGENDLEMLKMVRDDGGIAVAVGNAVPKLKAVAQYVVGSNDEDGVADALRRFARGI